MVTALVLLVAVTIDAVARRNPPVIERRRQRYDADLVTLTA
jgi:hypothetical protein